MEEYKTEVLKKLGKRRKMFEDYIALVKKQAGEQSSLGVAARGKKRVRGLNN